MKQLYLNIIILLVFVQNVTGILIKSQNILDNESDYQQQYLNQKYQNQINNKIIQQNIHKINHNTMRIKTKQPTHHISTIKHKIPQKNHPPNVNNPMIKHQHYHLLHTLIPSSLSPNNSPRLLYPYNQSLNYIYNSQFNLTSCPSTNFSCLKNNNSPYDPLILEGWEYQPEFQIGRIKSFSATISTQKFSVKLLTFSPICIYQKLTNLITGDYLLYIQYFANYYAKLNKNKILVYWNNLLIGQLGFISYYMLNGSFNISNIISNQIYQVKLCGYNSMNQKLYGSTVSAVKLYYMQINESLSQNYTNTTIFYIYSNLKQYTLQNQYFKNINQFPCNRIIFRPLFSLFNNFDQLWLYTYNKRFYTKSMKQFLLIIRQLENIKIVNKYKKFVLDLIQFDINKIKSKIDVKIQYFQYQKDVYFQLEARSNTFSTNFFHYFFMDMIFIILTFLIGKTIHKFIYQFSIKLKTFFDQYQSNIFLFLMILQGNYQIFSYFFISDILSLFNSTFQLKLINFCSVLTHFWFILFIFTSYFLIKYLYKHKATQLYTNCRHSSIKSIFYMCIFYGSQSFILGMVHKIGYNVPNFQIKILLSIQSIYVILLVYVLYDQQNFFRYKSLAILNILSYMIRIFIIFLISIQQNNIQNQNQNQNEKIMLMDQIIVGLLLCYIFIWCINCLVAVFILIINKIINKNQKNQKNIIIKQQIKSKKQIETINDKNQKQKIRLSNLINIIKLNKNQNQKQIKISNFIDNNNLNHNNNNNNNLNHRVKKFKNIQKIRKNNQLNNQKNILISLSKQTNQQHQI